MDQVHCFDKFILVHCTAAARHLSYEDAMAAPAFQLAYTSSAISDAESLVR